MNEIFVDLLVLKHILNTLQMLPTIFISNKSHLKFRLNNVQTKLIIAMGFSNETLEKYKKYFENFETINFANFEVNILFILNIYLLL